MVVDPHEAAGEATCRWPRESGRSLDLVVGGSTRATAAVARALARLGDPDASGGSAALPACIGHAELLGLTGARPADVTDRWPHGHRRLQPTVGVGESGPVTVDLDADGPHLVVVGERGSGKTEHLSAMVIALAAAHRPEDLHLVLWGESFGHLHRLPHVASAVTRTDDGTLTAFPTGATAS